MEKNLFSGLEDLGLDKLEDVDLYKKTENNINESEEGEKSKVEVPLEERQKIHIYDKEINCPVCGHDFKVRMVKTSSPRVTKKDSDFCINYDVINPYFYDIWLCNHCGYASMKADFLKLRDFQKKLIAEKISPKWHGRAYPDVYDVNMAIERYKLSLYNSVVFEASSSRKAMNCLKLAWMYRLTKDLPNEQLFLKQAIDGFTDAFNTESTPIYGMAQGTLMFLIGELYRRTEDYDNANIWLSKLITTQNIDQKIKEMARTQRDLIKEAQLDNNDDENDDEEDSSKNKKGFFSKFFK